MTIKADTRKTTSLLKKHLKETFGIKTSVRSESYSGGSSLRVSYDLGIDEKTISGLINCLQYGHFNGMEDIYEYDRKPSLIIDGFELNTYKYVSVNQEMSREFKYKLVKMFSDTFSFHNLPTLECIDDMNTNFSERWGDAWNWGDMIYRFFKVRNFITNNEEEVELVSCVVDGDLNNGIIFNYKVGGVMYNTKEFKLPTKKKAVKKIKKVAKKVTQKVVKEAVVENVIAPKTDIDVVEYSERALAVFGNTKPIKEDLKNIGGRYNRFLTNPNTQEKQAGWVFSKRFKKQVLELVG